MGQLSIWRADSDVSVSTKFVKVASLAVVAFSIAMPAVRVYFIALTTSSFGAISGRAVYAALAVACYMPIQVWLVLSAIRRPFGKAQGLGLAAIAVVMFAMIPIVGVGWVGILYMLGALVLAGLQPPWSLVLYAALLVTPAPLTVALNQPEWAPYFTTGMVVFPVSLAVAIWLIRTARDLHEARWALAHQGVLRERQRIDDEIGNTLGVELAAIGDRCRRAEKVAAQAPSAAESELRQLGDDARSTLAQARRVVARYREVSFGTELNTMCTLLSAAGIDAKLELPPHLPQGVDEYDRESLRREIARFLEATPPGAKAVITVTTQGGRVNVGLRSWRGADEGWVAAR